MPHKTETINYSAEDGWLCVDAPAKLNLFLHITGRRPNGYHELESLFVFTEFGDKIWVRKSAQLSLKIVGDFAASLTSEGDNLVLRAAQALALYSEQGLGAEIILEKNIPLSAGLGGGSSDAAATLRALIQLWGVYIKPHELEKIALSLGADVPACLYAQQSLVKGIGEIISPLAKPLEFYCVLVNDGTALSTPDIFKTFETQNLSFSPKILETENGLDVGWMKNTKNDLFEPACLLAPEIKNLVDEMSGFEDVLLARMTGSGATCFALTKKLKAAENVAKIMKKRHPNFWCKVSKTI